MKKRTCDILISMIIGLTKIATSISVSKPALAQTGSVLSAKINPSARLLSQMNQDDKPQPRATQPAEQAAPPTGLKQQSKSTWTLGPLSPFDWTRFDGAFVPGPIGETWANKVYFLGGRSGGSTEDPTIWRFDPSAGTYTDTGLDVIEDVSNYTANVIPDDSTGRGPAIYIIGGYNADGATRGNIGTVQRFYPQSGVVEALPAADNWTVTMGGNLIGGMGQAVVGNKIYVFGGWENISPPYYYAGTWAFDPAQASGSRWTNLSLNLNPARSYIQVTVQDSKIYAMGGNFEFIGGDLVPTTVVEVLDTDNLGAGWVLLSPMPVASGEGSGFGFDSDSLAPAPWQDHLYVVGGGDWPASSGESMDYLINSDTWDQTFPDLLNARSDHAGVFIPTCTPDPSDGLPGLWVFGGRMTSDTPPYGPTEFYPLECEGNLDVHILDANTGSGIPNAYVGLETPSTWDDGFTNADGRLLFEGLLPSEYLVYASAKHYEFSYEVTTAVTKNMTTTLELSLNASQMVLSSTDPLEITQPQDTTETYTLQVGNTGTAPLRFSLNVLDEGAAEPPVGEAIPELPRVDKQIAQDIAVSPDGKTDFFVALKDEPDLNAAYAIVDWQRRGQYVYDTLKQHAEATQLGLRKFLDGRGVTYTSMFIVNGVIVHGGNITLVEDLAAREDVAQIVANRKIEVEEASWVDKLLAAPIVPMAVEWGISKVKANDVWALGYNGTGVVVAEIDTGTQWDHPSLRPHYRGWNGTSADHNYSWFDPYGQSPGAPSDAFGHGTHVMGTMVGDDGGANQIGMAPGSKWISCKGGDNVSGYLLTNEQLICAQWMLAPTDVNGDHPNPAKRPHVVNNSWGGGQEDYWYGGAVAAWHAAGIFSSFSNGNSGPGCSTAGSPGDNLLSFSSGATDINDAVVSFSSRGPSAIISLLKPNVTSPGFKIRSSIPTSGYAFYSGTSMASPHTAGAVALVWSAAPELIGQVDLTGWLLEQTAMPITTTQGCGGDLPTDVPNNTYGWGRLDALAAVNLARAGGITPDWITVDPMGTEVIPGDTITVSLVINAPVTLGTYHATLWMVADDPYRQDVRWPITLEVVEPAYLIYLPLAKKP